MSPKIARNIEAAVVCIGAIAVVILVPDGYFFAASMAMLVGGIGGVVGSKKYIERLEAGAARLDSAGRSDEATDLRVRKRMIVDVGVAFAIVGLTAFIALVVVYGE